MSVWSEVNWSEGMFLRPHHLQLGQRHAETLVAAGLDALAPYGWGCAELEINTSAVEENLFSIERCTLRLKDGTWIKVPENTQVDPRDFGEALDKSGGHLDVWFGVPSLQTVRANLSQLGAQGDGRFTRYLAEPIERYDENTGANPQYVEIRRMQGAVLFGDEDRSGHDALRIARVQRSARANAAPELVEMAIPPLLTTGAWGPLHRMLMQVVHAAMSKNQVLARGAKDRQMSFSTASPAEVEHLIKLHVLNEATSYLGALMETPVLHPHDVYLAYCRLVGQLSLFHEDRMPGDLPAYDHQDCGPCFARLTMQIKALLDLLVPEDYIARPFEEQPLGLGVALEHEWIAEGRDMYIGIESALDVEDLQRHLAGIDFKMASPADAPELHRRRLPGLEFRETRVPPGALPQRQGLHYFRIGRDAIFWPKVEQERALNIRVRQDQMAGLSPLNVTLYVVKARA